MKCTAPHSQEKSAMGKETHSEEDEGRRGNNVNLKMVFLLTYRWTYVFVVVVDRQDSPAQEERRRKESARGEEKGEARRGEEMRGEGRR